jgi:hypothetical protein
LVSRCNSATMPPVCFHAPGAGVIVSERSGGGGEDETCEAMMGMSAGWRNLRETEQSGSDEAPQKFKVCRKVCLECRLTAQVRERAAGRRHLQDQRREKASTARAESTH